MQKVSMKSLAPIRDSPLPPDSLPSTTAPRYWRRKFWASMVFSAPLFLLSMVFMYIPGIKEGLETPVLGFPLLEVLTFLLATPVQVGMPWFPKRLSTLLKATPLHTLSWQLP